MIPNASSRPADVYLPTWERRLPSALDVTVISPLQLQTVDIAATTQGHAITVAESRKMTFHAESCRSQGINFIPLVVESLGGWSLTVCHTMPTTRTTPRHSPFRDYTTTIPETITSSVEGECQPVATCTGLA